MADARSGAVSTDGPTSETESRHQTIEAFEHSLTTWRTRIDELVVQASLVSLDIRDEMNRRLEVAENTYLAARSSLTQVEQGGAASLEALRRAVEHLAHDIGQVYEAADDVVKRERSR